MHSKKHLKFKALIESVKKEFNKIEDTRGKNKSNSIPDVMLSGIACMYFQCPSLLGVSSQKVRKFSVSIYTSDIMGCCKVMNQVAYKLSLFCKVLITGFYEFK